MFGTIYVLTNPFLSFLCIDSIKALRFEPFAPIADNKAFKRLAFAISRFEVEGVEGVEGVLTCGVVGFLPCKRPSVERRGKVVWLHIYKRITKICVKDEEKMYFLVLKC